MIVEEAATVSSHQSDIQPHTTNDTQPSPDISTTTAKNDNVCSICHVEYIEKPRLKRVECTSCSSWLHKKCDPYLRSITAWKRVQMANELYPCPKWRQENGEYAPPVTISKLFSPQKYHNYSKKGLYSSHIFVSTQLDTNKLTSSIPHHNDGGCHQSYKTYLHHPQLTFAMKGTVNLH